MMNSKQTLFRLCACLIAVAMMVSITDKADAKINPKFTPIDLVKDSDVILLLEFKDVDKDGKATAVIKKVIKGKEEAKEVTIDLQAGAYPDQAKDVIETIKGGVKEALLFFGEYKEGGARGMLHLNCDTLQWVTLAKGDKCNWDMEKQEKELQATWAGGTDMLLRALEYIQSDTAADVPVGTDGFQWGQPISAGKIPGKVSSAMAVDVNGDGKLCLFITSDGGDKIFQIKDDKVTDITAARKLTGKSQTAVWADFNMDGKLDLLSFDGKGLTLHTQQADGTFASSPLDVGDTLKVGCVGLEIAPNTKEGRQVIIATPASPLSLIISKDSKAVAKPLVEGEFPGKDMGVAGNAFVADIDGDGLADVIQLFANGSLFYKGKADGQFAAPVKSQASLGRGRSAACLGDYDGDGLLDIFVTSENSNHMWQNIGGGKFAETLNWCGELTYISKPDGVFAATCDINNDGRQDVMIAYDKMAPLLFFNRGFRSFGHARDFDIANVKDMPESASSGQQAACIADFRGNGGQDMVLVLKDGGVYYLPHDSKITPLSVAVALPANSPNEPVLVTVKNAKRSFGAFNVTAASPAFIGLTDAGAVTVTWTLPGQKPQSKEVEVLDAPVRFVIGEGK